MRAGQGRVSLRGRAPLSGPRGGRGAHLHLQLLHPDHARARGQEAGRKFNGNISGLSFGLKNGFRFRFDSVTCLNYPIVNFLFVQGISSQN